MRRLSPRQRAIGTVTVLAAFSACDMTQFCPSTIPPIEGQLGSLSDAVLITPPSAGEDAHTFLVMANPELEQLRVYDTFDQTFVAAPNVYFPLAIQTGPATRRLAVAAQDSSHLLALDGAAHQIFVVRAADDELGPAFTVAGVVETAPAPADLAVRQQGDVLIAYVALPDDAAVQVLRIEPGVGQGEEIDRVVLAPDARPSRLALTPTGETLVVIDPLRAVVTTIDTTSLTRTETELPFAAQDVVVGRIQLEETTSLRAVLAAASEPSVAVVELAGAGVTAPQVLGVVELPGPPLVAFVPDHAGGTTSLVPCCAAADENSDGVAERPAAVRSTDAFAAVATTTGRVVYVRLDGPIELIDTDEAGVGLLDGYDLSDGYVTPTGGGAGLPSLTFTDEPPSGTPPRAAYFGFAVYTWWYEGALPALEAREGTVTGSVLTVFDLSATEPLEDTGLRAGDQVVFDTAERGGSCPDRVEAEVLDFAVDTITVAFASAAEETCVSLEDSVVFTIFAAADGILVDAENELVGREYLPPPDEGSATYRVPGATLSVTASEGGLPPSGSRLELPVDQHLDAAGMQMSVSAVEGGFGAAARIPTAFVGGEILIQETDADTPASSVAVRRMWLTTATGRLYEMDQAEVEVRSIVDQR